MSNAFQDYYSKHFSFCYGCGADNPDGLQLKSFWEGERTVARFTPDPRFTGGVPDHVYGGLVASLLDCHGNAAAFAYAHRELGQDMAAAGGAGLRFVTASLKVDFVAPTPMSVELEVHGDLRSLEGRKAWIDLSLSADGKTCATGEMLAILLRT